MKMTDIVLSEAPLPDDWDHGVYNNPKRSFKAMLDYAIERAKKIGSGSSRVAFEIEYKGRPTILKIAKNNKGIAQNAAETELFEDGYLNSLDIVIPMIDYDEENREIRWIHTEKAEKVKEKYFQDLTGIDSMHELIEYCYKSVNDPRYAQSSTEKRIRETLKDTEECQDFIDKLRDLFGSFPNIGWQDIKNPANWGLFDGKPVIIDLGYTDETRKLYGG